MHDMPEEEARALLSRPHTCVECNDWVPQKMQPGTVMASSGLVDQQGIGTGMYVQLVFSRSPKTKMVRFKCTVFQTRHGAQARVYQLDVQQSPKLPKDRHSLPHEHFGAARSPIDSNGCHNWNFEDVLSYFCGATGIRFEPALSHPEDFQLKGQ